MCSLVAKWSWQAVISCSFLRKQANAKCMSFRSLPNRRVMETIHFDIFKWILSSLTQQWQSWPRHLAAVDRSANNMCVVHVRCKFWQRVKVTHVVAYTMCCRSWPCGFFHGTESSQTKRRRPSRCSLRPLVVFVKKDQKATQRKSSIYNTTTCCCLFLLTLTAGFSIFSASPFSCYHSKRRRIDNRPTASSFCYPKEKRTTG